MLRHTHERIDPLRGLRVLLVEDAPDNRFLITKILESAGACVDTANDGVEGIERAYSANFDVVLMDIQMPRMDGFDAVRTLKRSNYTVPIVALTAHSRMDDRRKTHDAGFSDHLTKPINSGELVTCVLQWAQLGLESCSKGAANSH